MVLEGYKLLSAKKYYKEQAELLLETLKNKVEFKERGYEIERLWSKELAIRQIEQLKLLQIGFEREEDLHNSSPLI